MGIYYGDIVTFDIVLLEFYWLAVCWIGLVYIRVEEMKNIHLLEKKAKKGKKEMVVLLQPDGKRGRGDLARFSLKSSHDFFRLGESPHSKHAPWCCHLFFRLCLGWLFNVGDFFHRRVSIVVFDSHFQTPSMRAGIPSKGTCEESERERAKLEQVSQPGVLMKVPLEKKMTYQYTWEFRDCRIDVRPKQGLEM
jgi:hypothetical protein